MVREVLEDKKSLTVEVSKECWKKLKILSIQKEISLLEQVKDVLERFTNKKTFEEIKEN